VIIKNYPYLIVKVTGVDAAAFANIVNL